MESLLTRGAPWRARGAFSRAIRQLVLALALVAGLLAPRAPGLVSAAGPPRANPPLLQDAAAHPDSTFRVVVTRAAPGHAADDYVAAKGHAKVGEFGGIGFVANVPGKDLADIAANPAVKSVSIDSPMLATGGGNTCSAPYGSCYLADIYTQAVKAPQDWTTTTGSTTTTNWTGAGVGVAVIDTGINLTLDFGTSSSSSSSRIVTSQKFSSTTNNMSDGYGHGTHVAGIIAGNSWWSSNKAVQGKYIGIAPGANLLNLKSSDDNGVSYTSDVANAIEWAISNRAAYNIRVINLSMVATTPESYLTSALDAEVERAWFNGILVVVAAGNSGANSALYPPANDPFVVTVGAADSVGTAGQGDDTVVPWSSYGTTQDGFAKPDVLAPGRAIASVLASGGSVLAKQFAGNIVDSNYITLSGTSMAAPVVSGTAALIFQAHPDWTNDQVKWVLINTAKLLGTTSGSTFTPFVGQGAGEVDARASIIYSGTPGYANQGLPINTYLVGPNGQTTYSNTAPLTNSTSSWSTSSWSTSSWSTSSWSTSSWSTSSWSTSSWSTTQ